MIKKTAFISILTLLVQAISPAIAADIREDQLRIGKPGSSANKEIRLGSTAKLRYSTTDSKLQFSHDGTNYKSIGSGSGGGAGISILGDVNPDFEAGTASWTTSGGSFTAATSGTNLLFDTKSGVFNASAASQTLTGTLVSIPGGLQGANGFVSCYFKGSATDYKIQAWDGTNVLAERTIPALTSAQEIGVTFIFPSSGSTAVRVISGSDAADLALDNCHLGTMSQGPVSQATMYGAVKWAATTACAWSTTSGAYGAFAADSDCPTPTVTGSASAPATKIPAITFSSLPPGEYAIYAWGSFGKNNTSGSASSFRLFDGTISGGDNWVYTNTLQHVSPVVSGRFSYSVAQSNVTFQIQAYSGTAGQDTQIKADSLDLNIAVYRFPTSQEQAFRPDQVAWKVDANISGANPSLGTADVTTYSEITNGTLTLTQNAGSIATQIACASGTASTGTTCSVNESIGVAFTAPTAGDVKACASFTHHANRSSNALVAATFQIIETSNTSSAILQEGKTRIMAIYDGPTAGNVAEAKPFRVCGNFNFASAGLKTLRLAYEQDISPTVNDNVILADAAAVVGQRDIHWEVYPISQAIPAPLLVGSVTSNSSGLERVERMTVDSNCTSSPCTVTSQSGAWLSSVTREVTGQYVFNINTGTFSGTPSCTCTCSADGSSYAACVMNHNFTPSANSVRLNCAVGGNPMTTLVDARFEAICMGPR